MNRRDFLRGSTRLLLASGLVFTGGYLALSGRVSLRRSCPEEADCSSCSRKKNCTGKKDKNTMDHGRG